MDGMVALREMYKTKIQSATRAAHAKSELDKIRDEIIQKTNGDRALVLKLIKAYREKKADQEAVDLMERSATLSDVGLGDHRVDILVQGAQALKGLGGLDHLRRAAQILDGCVDLIPTQETFGVLGGIHKKLRGVFEKQVIGVSCLVHCFLVSLVWCTASYSVSHHDSVAHSGHPVPNAPLLYAHWRVESLTHFRSPQ